jgi:hypothetical protein
MHERKNMSYPVVPFDRSYWVVPGRLLAGCYPGDLDAGVARDKVQGLLDAGIRHVVSLMEETETNWDGEPFAGYREEFLQRAGEMKIDVSWARRPIRDMAVPSRGEMTGILNEIDGVITADRPVYVHCWGGKGRTGTVVGCYLARHAFASGERVLEMIRELRANVPGGGYDSPETERQREMVRSWKIGE